MLLWAHVLASMTSLDGGVIIKRKLQKKNRTVNTRAEVNKNFKYLVYCAANCGSGWRPDNSRMSSLVPDSSFLFCMIAWAVSEIFAVWQTRRTSSYSGFGRFRVMRTRGSFGEAMPRRMWEPLLEVREDGRELGVNLFAEELTAAVFSAVESPVVCLANFGVAIWCCLSLEVWALREAGRHSVSIVVDDPKSSSLLCATFPCKELERDGTIPESKDAPMSNPWAFDDCNSSRSWPLWRASLNFASCFLRWMMILVCCRFASSRMLTSRTRSLFEARIPFKCLSKKSAVLFRPYFCESRLEVVFVRQEWGGRLPWLHFETSWVLVTFLYRQSAPL